MGFVVVTDTTQGLRDASKNVDRMRITVALTLAKFVAAGMKEAILTNAYQVAPKSKKWAERSISKTPLVNTGEYARGIRPVRIPDGAAVAGNWLLAKLHEGGTRKMPARPHIRPTIKRLNEQLGGVISEDFYKELFSG
jgi:HK97 gp10 family phage protein